MAIRSPSGLTARATLQEKVKMSIRSKSGIVIIARIALTMLLAATTGRLAHAESVMFITPSGSMSGGGPVNAEADVTTSAGSISITLLDLQSNPKDVAQLLSGFSFTLGNGGLVTGSSETGASSQELTVNGNGTFGIGANLTTVPAVGWVYTTSSSTEGNLDVLQGPGHAGPAHLIIGPPGGATFANGNGSIDGNGPHNPFLNQSATFTITAPNVSADTTITGVVFAFGTTEDAALVRGVMVPEPSSLFLGLVGLGLVSSIGFCRRRRGS
jgi:hypothetical protein